MKNCGLRKAYADGGLLDDFNKRLRALTPGVTQGDVVANTQMLEDQNRAADFERMQGKVTDISGASGLSQRQKAAALGQLGSMAAKQGMQLDTGVGNLTGLSARQQLSNGMTALSDQNAIGDFDLNRQKQVLSAEYADARDKKLGFRQGGTVGVDKDGWIEGPGGVDNVPARVAETGEEIRVGAGERIVNKQQNAALEKLAEAAGMDLDDYLEGATGKPVGPTMKKGLRAAADGLDIPEFIRRQPNYAVTQGQQFIEPANNYAGIKPNAVESVPPHGQQVLAENFKSPATAPVGDEGIKQIARERMAARAAQPALSQAAPVAEPVQMNTVRGSAPGVLSADAVQHLQNQAATEQRFAQAGEEALARQVKGTQWDRPHLGGPTAAEQAAGAQPQARVQQPSRAPYGAPEAVAGPSQTPPGKPPTRMEGLKAGAVKWGGRLNAAGQLAAGANDIINANEPAEQVMGALKASGALPGLAGIPGKVAMYGDMALGMAGTSGAKLLDKVARLHPDYMLDKNREWGTAGTQANNVAPDLKPVDQTPKPTPSAQPQPGDKKYDERFDGTDRRLPEVAAQDARQARTEELGLRAAGQFIRDGQVPKDIRFSRQNETNAPMATWNSKNDVAAGSIGSLKKGTYIQPEDGTGIVSIRQKDGSYKNIAMGQSEYMGTDGKPTSDYSKSTQYQRGLADAANLRRQLDTMQRMRAHTDAFDETITDPSVRANGLRQMALYGASDAAAAKAAGDQTKLQLDLLKFDQEERKMKNLQGNSDREFNDKRAGNRDKVLNDWLDNYSRVPTKDGKSEIDYGIRNELQAAMLNVGNGEIPSNPNELSKHLTTYGNQARLTARMNAAVRQHGGVTDPRNWGVRGKTSTQATVPTPAGTDMFGNELVRIGDMKVPLRDIVGDDADLLAEYKRRINSGK